MEMILGQGDSMKGLFGHGDPIQVDTSVRSFNGDGVYVFRVGEDEFIRSLQSIPSEGIRVIASNPNYKKWTITNKMDFEVLGKVVRAWEGQVL